MPSFCSLMSREEEMALRVLIADQHELFRNGLEQVLERGLGAVEVYHAATFEEVIEQVAREPRLDLIFVDQGIEAKRGHEAVEQLRELSPEAKLIIVSSSEAREDIINALAAGAHGYLPKSMRADEVSNTVEAVLRGGIFVPPIITRTPPARPLTGGHRHREALTPRQQEVLGHLLMGKPSKEIARVLGLTEGTVKIHLSAIYRLLGVRNRAEAIAMHGEQSRSTG
jgi:DNA-binding NarL/FixJ family response regulator